MIRQEFIIGGCLLVVAGLLLGIVGYNKTQPTNVDKAISIMEQFSGEKAPAELKSSNSSGYVLFTGGGIAFLIGLGLILQSRAKPVVMNNGNEGSLS